MSFREYVYDLLGFGIGAGLCLTFYSCLKAGLEIANLLKEASEYEIDDELVKKISSLGQVDGCIWGKVKADEAPIHSIEKPEITGVIWKQSIKEKNIAKVMGLWLNYENLINESTRTVPFSLHGNGTSVKLCSPSALESVDLTLVSEKFETANISLTDHFIGWMKGICPTGVKYTEEMLVQNTRVMGIGKLLSDKGKLVLKPLPPLPFILTTQEKESVIEEVEYSLPLYRFMGLVTACGALYFLLRVITKLHRNWEESRQQRKLERILNEAKIRRATQCGDLPESLMCVICCDLRDVVLMPCKHVCICGDCFLKLDPRICPVCRTKINSVEPVYYS